jgi:hypothetical protein
MPKDDLVFSDEPLVEASTIEKSVVTMSEADAPTLEVIFEPEPDVEVDGSTSSTVQPPVLEVVEINDAVVDVSIEEQAFVDISAVGIQGPQGYTGAVGPQGPQGQQGPPGLAGQGASVDFVFDVPSTVWALPHGLGRRVVDVVTVDNNDEEIIGDVYFIDSFNSRVEFYYPTSGRATVST